MPLLFSSSTLLPPTYLLQLAVLSGNGLTQLKLLKTEERYVKNTKESQRRAMEVSKTIIWYRDGCCIIGAGNQHVCFLHKKWKSSRMQLLHSWKLQLSRDIVGACHLFVSVKPPSPPTPPIIPGASKGWKKKWKKSTLKSSFSHFYRAGTVILKYVQQVASRVSSKPPFSQYEQRHSDLLVWKHRIWGLKTLRLCALLALMNKWNKKKSQVWRSWWRCWWWWIGRLQWINLVV